MELTQLTQQQYEQIKRQLDDLINNERPKVLTELAEARAQGDLSENADYDAARAKQGRVEAKIANLTKVLENVEIVENCHDGKVAAGSVVTVRFIDTNEIETYEIVNYIRSASTELTETFTDPDSVPVKISTECPLAKALINAEDDDKVVQVNYTTQSNFGKVQRSYKVEILDIRAA